MTFERTKYKTTTPEKVRDCLNAGMSIRRTAEYLECSLHSLRAVCTVFDWHPKGWSGPKPNMVELPKKPMVNSVFNLR